MKKVLLVNDSRFESIVMKDILNTLGYDVKITDEYSALSDVKSYCPDFVISNYIMREMRGDQLIEKVKQANSNIICILSSNNPISSESLNSKRIDGILRTPASRLKLEHLLGSLCNSVSSAGINKSEGLDKKEKAGEAGSPPAGRLEYKTGVCENCGQSINNQPGKSFAFCPFCGHKLLKSPDRYVG